MQTISPLLAVALVIAGIAAAAYSFWRYDFLPRTKTLCTRSHYPFGQG